MEVSILEKSHPGTFSEMLFEAAYCHRSLESSYSTVS